MMKRFLVLAALLPSLALGAPVLYENATGAIIDPSGAKLPALRLSIGLGVTNVPEFGGIKLDGATNGSVTLSAEAVAGTAHTFFLPAADGTNGQVLKTNGGGHLSFTNAASGTGDVVGPASATDNAIARFDLTTGKIIQNSGITIADGASGTLSGTNTGDQTISITGDGTASGGTGALTLAVTKINGTSLAGLATGLLKNTATTGVPSIAAAGTDYLAPSGSGAGLSGVTLSAIVPNTTPGAGQILVGNAGGTAYAPVSSSGDVTVGSTGAFIIGAAKVTNAMLAGSITNANLANSSITIGSTIVALGATGSTIAGVILTAPVINGLTSSGSTSLNFSGNSGTFLTSTGANTIGGDATFNGSISMTASGKNVTLSPTGGGTFTAAPAGAAAINAGSTLSLTSAGGSAITITSSGAGTINNMSIGQTTALAGSFTTLTNTGAATNSAAGAASTPALKLSGVPFAGTGTTSFPLLYINDANATASTTLSTSGTSFGINAHTGIGNLADWMLDGTSKFKITGNGSITNSGTISAGNSVKAGSGTTMGFTSGTILTDTSNGRVQVSNSAGTAGIHLDVATDGTLKILTRGAADSAILNVNAASLTGALAITGASTLSSTLGMGGTAITYGALPSGSTTDGSLATFSAQTYTVTGTNTATAFQANYHGIPTFTDASAGTVTDLFSELWAGPSAVAGSLTGTRKHTLGIVDATQATSTITGGFVLSTTLGTTGTSVSIGGGRIYAGDTIYSGNGFGMGTGNLGYITPRSNGVFQLADANQTSFGYLIFGINSNSAPAIGLGTANNLTFQSGAGTATWNDANTANSGTAANRYSLGIAAPTYTSTGTSVTDTVASTVYIGGAPTASTNTTITTPYALNVAANVSNFGGPIIHPRYTVSGLPSTAATGKVQGAIVVVTDALTPAFLVTVVGGGSTVAAVLYDGTNWVAF